MLAGFPNPLRLFVSWLVHRWAKAAGYVTLTPPRQLEHRQLICDNCEHSGFGENFDCSKCGCVLLAKRGLALEECPVGLWHRVWRKK